MPYISPENRPLIDEAVHDLAQEIAGRMTAREETAELSSRLRAAIMAIARHIRMAERGAAPAAESKATVVAQRILEVAAGHGVKGGWCGELNYALTRLIQAVPHELVGAGQWAEPFRYWIYAQTVGALTRSAWDLHRECNDDYTGNGLCGVLTDIKDEYKRRVNTAYEAAQIRKSGDCYDLVPFRTKLVPVNIGGVRGHQEIMLEKQELVPCRKRKRSCMDKRLSHITIRADLTESTQEEWENS